MVLRGARVKLVDGLAAPVYLDLNTRTAPAIAFLLHCPFSSGVVPRRGMNNWLILDAPAVGALAVDGAGNLYVADYHRVLKYTPGP